MWVDERHRRILEMIAALGRIEAEAIAAQLRVSRETIRRDLKQLEESGRVRRVHGGAIPADTSPEKPFRARRRTQVGAKRRIGRAAAALLRPGQTCFIDAGTTTVAFAGALVDIPNVLVVTNSIEVAAVLRAGDIAREIVLLGGRFGTEVPATSGELTISEIGRFRADIAVLSPVGVDPRGGVTYHAFGEAEIARAMMNHAAGTILLADHTKLGLISRAAVCECRELQALVTDAGAETLDAYRRAGVHIVICPER